MVNRNKKERTWKTYWQDRRHTKLDHPSGDILLQFKLVVNPFHWQFTAPGALEVKLLEPVLPDVIRLEICENVSGVVQTGHGLEVELPRNPVLGLALTS